MQTDIKFIIAKLIVLSYILNKFISVLIIERKNISKVNKNNIFYIISNLRCEKELFRGSYIKVYKIFLFFDF